jgi:hypothetical protein
MPQEIDTDALKAMPEVRLPAAKLQAGNSLLGVPAGPSGRSEPGTIPHRDIPHQDFPRVVYLHPRKPYRRLMVPIDGHGNKEWQWIANEAKVRKVADQKELDQALKEGYKTKHYVVPPRPIEDAEEEAPVEAK